MTSKRVSACCLQRGRYLNDRMTAVNRLFIEVNPSLSGGGGGREDFKAPSEFLLSGVKKMSLGVKIWL